MFRFHASFNVFSLLSESGNIMADTVPIQPQTYTQKGDEDRSESKDFIL
jgi:hypothetical protein